jgi:hypothetical protein
MSKRFGSRPRGCTIRRSANRRPQRATSKFWIRELPFSLVLILTLLGVAYTSFLKQQPIMGYWELLAPIIGVVCLGSGWSSANDKNARLQLILTQALHRAAFLLVMNMILLPSVQRILNASATGLAVLILLAPGTFSAGFMSSPGRSVFSGSSWRSAFRRPHGTRLRP